MRHFLTFLGIALCLALAALMGAPHVIDWSRFRGDIERHLTQVAGMPVLVEGNVALTLLPTPSVTLDRVRAGNADERGFRPFEAERVTVLLAATSLLRGEVQVTDATVDTPILRLGSGLADQGWQLATPTGPNQVRIDRLQFRDGTVVVDRPGREALTVSAIGAEVEATSLLGPFKGSGRFTIGEDIRSFRYAIGRIEGGRARLKGLAEDLRLALRLDMDGTLALPESGGSLFEGMLSLTGQPELDPRPGDAVKGTPVPLRATARANVTAGQMKLDELAVTLGSDPTPFTAAGEATLQFGTRPRLNMVLSARSYDFDRAASTIQPTVRVPADVVAQLGALAASGSGGGDLDGAIDLTVGGIIIGGQTIVGGRVVGALDAGNISISHIEGELPGQTRIAFDREGGGPAGRLDIDSRDPERLMRWYSGGSGAVTPSVSLKASARLSPIKDGLALEGISIGRGNSTLTGSGTVLLPAPGIRPAARVALTLASPRLDIADVPAFEPGPEPAERGQALDFDLDLAATRLVFEGTETGKLVARVRRDGPILSIERIAVTEFGGASLIASGTIGGGARRLTTKLDADRLEALTALGEKLLPGALMSGFRQRAAQLSPAIIVATFTNTDADDVYDIDADGKLAGTQVKATGKLAGRTDLNLELSLGLENGDAGALLAQIGGRAEVAGAGGAGKLTLAMKGNPRAALATTIEGSMPGLEGRIAGSIRVFQAFAPFNGTIALKASDLGPVVAGLGVQVPRIAPGTAGTLEGRVVSTLERITIEGLKAEVAGQPFAGEIAFALNENGKVAGQIRTPRLDLRPAMALALGAPRGGAAPGSAWSTQAFGPALTPPLPGDLWIETERAVVDDSTTLEDAKFVLRFAAGAASVEYAHARLGALRMEGDILMRRIGPVAHLSGKGNIANLRLATLAGEGAARGEITAEAQLSGSGESPAKLVAALAGGGTLNIRGKVTPRHDPAALTRLLAQPLDRLGPLDAFNIGGKLEAELDKAPWTVPEVRTALVVVNGVVRTGVFVVEGAQVRHEANANLDLNTRTLDYRVTTTSESVPKDWRGALPQFTATWRGPYLAPKRTVSVDGLVNGYLALGLVRDLERAEILDQDIRERAMHNRRLKAEEARRRAEEEMRRAEELARLQEAERARREQAEAEERARRERAAEAERQHAEKAAEEARQRAEKAAEEARQRAAKAAEEDAARRERAQRALEQSAPRVVPPETPAGPPPASILPPPLNLNPVAPGRPRAAAPVEVRPLAPIENAR